MPIILAIEPDRRQRDALAAVVRKRVGAELVIADTTERALEAIGNRVPDLVLIPALLSPQDDAALAAALRVIAAAAHVRTLTIPVLAAYTEAAAPSGLFSRWRRGRPASETPDGCDPAVFADQIAAYLKESAAERALMADDVEYDQGARRDVGEAGSQASEYIQEFGQDEGQAGANGYVPADTQPYIRADEHPYVRQDAQAYAQPDVLYAQPDVSYAQPDVSYAQPDVSYTQPDAQLFAQPDETYVQPDVAYVPSYTQPEVQAYAQPDVPAYAQPDVQPYIQADIQQETLDAVEGDVYDTARADRDGLSALEEDIDLSDELAGLEPERSNRTRAETSDLELFDGEPFGVYTMPSGIDEPDADVPVPADRRAFGEARPAIEPAFAAEAIAGSDFDVEAALDPDFFAETYAEPVFDAQRRSEPVSEDAAVARAFEAETIDSAPLLVEHINPEDAEPEPSDAEPWVSAFLRPRWIWPAMEGVPTEPPPAAFATVEVPAAEARPAPAPHHKRDRPEWSELVASLRKDIERRRVEPPQEKPKPPTATVPTRTKKSKPVQDEWGFFDPEQCGFAALLAKLDEITEGEDAEVHQSK